MVGNQTNRPSKFNKFEVEAYAAKWHKANKDHVGLATSLGLMFDLPEHYELQAFTYIIKQIIMQLLNNKICTSKQIEKVIIGLTSINTFLNL